MDETAAREYIVRLEAARERLQRLDDHAAEVDDKTVELRRMIEAVQQALELPEGSELLVPLTNGVFMPATAGKDKTLYLNVGADVVVTRTPDETIKILEKQQDELAEYRERILAERQQAQAEAVRIERAAKEAMGDV